MSKDIRAILERLSALEGQITPVGIKHGLNPQQKSARQLPALFAPKKIKALGAKTDPQHPMKGLAVGSNESADPVGPSLAEAMQEVEEDMLSKVKRDLTNYLDALEKKMSGADDGRRDRGTPALDKLEKKTRIDRDLLDKAVAAVEKGRAEEADAEPDQEPVAEDPTEQEIGAHAPSTPIQNPTLPESAPVKTMTMEDGTVLEIHGNEQDGFEIRHGERSLRTRFPRLDHAQMAVDLFRARRAKNDLAQDYIEER